MGDSSPTSEAVLGNMPSDLPDWTQAVQLQGTVDIASVTTIDFINTLKNAKTVEIFQKATTVVEIGNPQHLIGSFSNPATTGAASYYHTFAAATVKFPYAALMITAVTDNNGLSKCVLAYAGTKATDPQIATYSAPFGPAPVSQVPPPVVRQCILPMSCQTAKALTIGIYKTTPTGPGSSTWYVYGLTRDPGVKLRSDGRAYPIGSRMGSYVGGLASGSLIAAPAYPLHIMLSSLVGTWSSPTGANMEVTATVQGSTYALLRPVASGGMNRHWESGLLLDAGTALDFSVSGTGPPFVWFEASYDLVV